MPSQEEWVEGPEGRSFYTKRWTPSQTVKAAVVFLHGFMEHINRYDHVFDRLCIRGIAIYAYDQRGFGKTAQKDGSQGITSSAKGLKDVSFFVKRTADILKQSSTNVPLFLFGHSNGGAFALRYATRQPPCAGVDLLRGVIASAPLIDQPDDVKVNGVVVRAGSVLGAVLPSLQLKVGVPSQDISRDPKVNEAYAADPLCPPIGSYKGVADMLLGGPKLIKDVERWPRDLPVFVYHGTDDKVTSFQKTKACFDAIVASDKTFKAYEGYYHELHNEPDAFKWVVVDDVEEWIVARTSLAKQSA